MWRDVCAPYQVQSESEKTITEPVVYMPVAMTPYKLTVDDREPDVPCQAMTIPSVPPEVKPPKIRRIQFTLVFTATRNDKYL